ncbi:MAG: lamin tail domain-containing protein, partial [Cyclobacteriaceae bacterium]
IILCPQDQVDALSPFGKAVGLASWPTLNNDRDHIRLTDASGKLIHSLSYDASWYRSSFKRDGGWSLEMIDNVYPCSGSKNWIASESENGGTPGIENSVIASNPDLTGPRLISAFANSPEQVILYFDEPLSPNSATAGAFEIDQGVVATNAVLQGLQEIILQLEPVLSQTPVYQIRVTDITDCGGNLINDEFNTATFALPQEADSLDMVINEILFNPRPMGQRFVELFNRSDKYINLKNWRLANGDTGSVANPKIFLENQNIVIAPSSYIAITIDAAILKGQYPKGKEENFIEASSMPSYPDDAGTVVLLNPLGNTMDWFDYQETYHYPLLSDRNGVSLERLTPDGVTNDPNNWKSAASTVGFATPGYQNSQSNQGGGATNPIEINPKHFSFNTPGVPYFTTIHYSFPDFGQVANVEVFDPQGHGIRKVAQNQLLQANGSFTWDGTNDQGQKVRAGYYLILFEVFNLNGEVAVYKETVAVTSAF